MTELTLFDYGQLDVETRIVVKQRSERIQERSRAIGLSIWENGRDLHEAQQELARHGYGCFIEWAESETGYSKNTIYNFIRVYQTFDSTTVVQSKIPAKALYLLASPSTPEEVRVEVIERAGSGEKITPSIVHSSIVQHRTPQPTPPPTARTYESAISTVQSPLVERRPPPPVTRPLGDNEVEAVIWRAIAHHAKSGTIQHRLAWLQTADVGDFSRLLNPGVSFETEQLDRIRTKVEAELSKQVAPFTDPVPYTQQLRKVEAELSQKSDPVTAPTNGSKMAVHFSSDSPEHYTPAEIITAAIECMGAIDLDPCSNSKTVPNVPALDHFTVDDDGLSRPWFGRIYMNPPYGRVIPDWVAKLKSEFDAGNVTEAIALVPSRTDTQWFRLLDCYPCCYVEGRLTFIGNEASAPFPSAIFYLGEDMEKFYWSFRHLGTIKVELDEHWFAQ